MKPWMKMMQDLTWLTQLGISITAPPLLCALGAGWLISRFGWPGWVMLPALLLGLGGAAASMWGFYRHAQLKAQKAKRSAAPAFNQHL